VQEEIPMLAASLLGKAEFEDNEDVVVSVEESTVDASLLLHLLMPRKHTQSNSSDVKPAHTQWRSVLQMRKW